MTSVGWRERGPRRVAVVGAGVSGLPAVKQCLEEGLEPVCYELRADLGGLWNYGTPNVRGWSCVMESTLANTCKETFSFSDFPVPSHYPDFMSHAQVMEYLRLYAQHFDLERFIHYNMEVVSVVRAGDFSDTGRWEVTVRCVQSGTKSASEGAALSTELFDGVLVSTGHHRVPYTPRYPGREAFSGTQLHAVQYRSVKDVGGGKRIVVVGCGNTGADVACELSLAGKQVFLSVRHDNWYIPRVCASGYPYDLNKRRATADILPWLPSAVRNWLQARLMLARYCSMGQGNSSPAQKFEVPVVNDDLTRALSTPNLTLKPNIRRITQHSVTFDDDTTTNDIDVIIYSTGYETAFPIVEKGVFELERGADMPRLYKGVIPPCLTHPTLAVVGLMSRIGAVIPVAEIQSRWAVRVIKGVAKLPSREHMLAEITTRFARIAGGALDPRTKKKLPGYDFIANMDDIAEEIGCKPNILQRLWTDPLLAYALYLGPILPYHYRLCGPGAWPDARRTILSVWDRISAPHGAGRGLGGSGWGIGTPLKMAVVVCALLWAFSF